MVSVVFAGFVFASLNHSHQLDIAEIPPYCYSTILKVRGGLLRCFSFRSLGTVSSLNRNLFRSVDYWNRNSR